MNSESIAILALFLSVILLVQLKFIIRYIKLKKISNNTPGALFLSSGLCDLLCCAFDDAACDICCCCASAINTDSSESEHEERVRSQRIKDRREKEKRSRAASRLSDIESKETKHSMDKDYFLLKQEQKNKIDELINKKQKTSLQWLSAVMVLPIDKVIQILYENPNYKIEDDFVINLKIQEKEDLKKEEE